MNNARFQAVQAVVEDTLKKEATYELVADTVASVLMRQHVRHSHKTSTFHDQAIEIATAVIAVLDATQRGTDG